MRNPPTNPSANDPKEVHYPDALIRAGRPEASEEDMQRPPSPITELRGKAAAGLPLTAEERRQVRAYNAKYNSRRKSLHIKGGREKEWAELAARQGVSLSTWLQEQVIKGLHGNDEALRDLREENQRLRDEIASLRGTCGQLSVENSNLQGRLEGLEQSLREAMQRLLDLTGAKP